MSRKPSTSIQRQLQLFFAGTLAFTVLIMGVAWISYNQVLLQREAERVLIVESDIIGTAARPALMFQDERLAGELLRTMQFDPDIAMVKLFTYDGKALSTYGPEGGSETKRAPVGFQNIQSADYSNGRLHLYRVVMQKDQPVGVIYLESRLNHLKESQRAGIIAVVVAMLGCLIFGTFLAFRLQRKIALPISSLAGLMRRVSHDRDYSLRAKGDSYNSETEELLAGFNQMAEEIEQNFQTIEADQVHLQKSEERFRNIVELAPVPVMVSRIADSRVLFANRSAKLLLGLDGSSDEPFDVVDFYKHPEARQQLLTKLQAKGAIHGQELEGIRPDGSTFWVSTSMNQMPFEGENALFSAFVDITEQKNIEQTLAKNNEMLEQRVQERTAELQKAKDELHATLDNMLDTYYRIYADGTVNWASESVHSLLGYLPSEVAGLTLNDLSADGLGFASVTEALSVNKGAVINEKVQLRHKSGNMIWASISAHWIFDGQGEVAGVEGVARDITAQVQAEEQKQQMESKMVHVQRLESLGVMAGGIAHDFNNILAGIMGNAELAGMHLLDGMPVQKELRNIVAGSSKAADLCQQMLDYSGQGSFMRGEVNMTSLVDEALQLIDVSISKNISLTLELANTLPDIHADKTQMQQIIMNLVTNAAESIGEDEHGSMTIRTSLVRADNHELESKFIEEKPQPGMFVALEVTDTGCGMDTATMDKLFDPFFTTKFTGRGLGMSAVLGIVRSHGGTIQVHSQPAQGTRFRVLIPVSSVQGEAIIPVEKSSDEIMHRGAGRTVLVVDDDMMVRTVVKRMLEKLGCKVLLASDGEEGMETYRRNKQEIDLILLDMTMPRMGGKEVLAKLYALDATLPVYICSGYSHDRLAGKFNDIRPAGFLQKPFALKSLDEMLIRFADQG